MAAGESSNAADASARSRAIMPETTASIHGPAVGGRQATARSLNMVPKTVFTENPSPPTQAMPW